MSKFLYFYQRFTNTVVNSTETLFYKLGVKVGNHPKRTILLCWLFVILSSFGFLRFHQEKNPMKLWVPPNTQFVYDTEWLMKTYQMGYREEIALITGDDVLTPEFLLYLLDIDETISNLKSDNNITWNDVCFKVPKVDKSLLSLLENPKNSKQDPSATMNAALYCSFVESMKRECYKKSILDLWDYDRDRINNLTKSDIVETINTYNKNDILSSIKNYEDLLGGIEMNSSGHIIRAKSVQNFWMVSVNFSAVDMDESGNIAGTADWASIEALEWEKEFLKLLDNYPINNNYSLYYSSARSFGDASSSTIFQDINNLSIGVFIMIIYVQFVISKFNWLEARVTLGCFGLLSVGMSFIVGCGLCSLFGISYGPVHTSLPFLLMGLGVDDMFVIIACWENLTKDEHAQLPIDQKIGLMLKHAGVSITVTSVTDILAFIVGSYTILPCLESYCIYAAFGVLMTFIFSVTFFTACFVLDQQRINNKRNGILFCYKHINYQPNECSQRQISNRAFEIVFDKIIFTKFGKIFTIAIAVISLGFSIESVRKLEQRFDPVWFIPKSSHFYDYLLLRREYFPKNGYEAGIYIGSINYTHEIINIKQIVDRLEQHNNTALDIVSWVGPFRDYVKNNFHTDIYQETLSDEYFNLYLSMFLFSPRNAKYQANIHFHEQLECGVPAPKIAMSNINFRFNTFSGPGEHLPAMHLVRDIAKESNFTSGDRFSTAWSKIFATWVTDEVIEIEVMRNLQLALICVMICTTLLIGDIQTCFWIFICVLLTMINVCGFMQRWGLTIDLVSCIGLELAIGLCVDYATHIGHTFLTIHDGDRHYRALKTVSTIGSAVLYGGLSTLIGVFMLSQSDAYIFQTFFKIFLLVITFGLFHGAVLLPVILTWIGPKPYTNGEIIRQDDIEIM